MLAKAGHHVDVAANGVEAVNAVRALPYDLVLMDVQMPEMDGVSATRAIRALGGGRAAVPIIALTANAMKGDREKYLAAGMSDYTSKPIDPSKLGDAIRRQCGVRTDLQNRAPGVSPELALRQERSRKLPISWTLSTSRSRPETTPAAPGPFDRGCPGRC